MQRQAETIGKRWDYCAKGYDAIVQNEFAGEVAEKWSRILKEHAPCEKGSVLDIGTGPGFFAILVGQMGWKVTGIDCSGKMVETASENAKKAGVSAEFYQMDNHQLDFPDESFDYIICRNVTWILYDPLRALEEWKRVLKPGGRILYFDANWHMTGDEVYREAVKRDEEEYRRLYGEPENTYTGDADTDEEFDKVLYFKEVLRPEWDEIHLPELGYEKIQVIPRVNEQVYSEEKKLLYRSIPMFLVRADKPEE